ncbi:class I SAM-dependent methyltransferase [Mycobacterium sp. RTGN5]|uniref:class I SAM-dependent methyltransferase n=1 Tax=Mycobacterium sp. RTGN5 TaxID=3016522 RepID=UPI0029C90B54|nr:class I SAM-dependent methyltransferase [Mycobacterium sp. RTGN5]
MPTEPGDQAVDQIRGAYDATPYSADSIPQSAPGRLAAIAQLFGLQTPPLVRARVLEIGCGAAGNLIPFAATHPEAQVVGIDLSEVAIDQGRRLVHAVGIQNVELVEADIATVDVAALGQFDYIVAHGVYSWVPENVQDAMLSLTSRSLAPNGVAYISYNVYPGWKSKEMVRDAMLFASRDSGSPEQKVIDARGMVDFLEEVTPPSTPLARAVAEFRERDNGFEDSYLVHDELASINRPCYFTDMLQRAGAHGLAFLAEAQPELMFPANYGATVAEHVAQHCGGSQPLIEQYLDFAVDRAFRQTLFVHADRAPEIGHSLDSRNFEGMHFATEMPVVDGPTRPDRSAQNYQLSSGATVSIDDPAMKIACDTLTWQSPWTLSRAQLVDLVSAELGSSPEPVGERIDQLLEFLIVNGQARYRLDAVSPDPVSVPLRVNETLRRVAEFALREGGDVYTFNLWHETVALGPLDAHGLTLLDGTRDSAVLVDELLRLAREGQLNVELDDGQLLTDEASLRDVFTQYVDVLPERLEEMKLDAAE